MLTFTPLAPTAPPPHTPGPWEAVPGTDWPGDELEIVAACDPGSVIAVIIGENREANARLMASSPALFDALTDLLGAVDAGKSTHVFRINARAAIAMATGGAP